MTMNTESMQSNLASFINSTSPVVPSHFLPKREVQSLNRFWHPLEREEKRYFTLADLWNSFSEASAYGVGVPISLDDGDTLVQYYVPYLSAIQIFISNSLINNLRNETESVRLNRHSSSDTSSDDSENERLSTLDDNGAIEGESLVDLNDRLGYIYFQYFESLTPYGRVPLMDKISVLAQEYPGLMSLRSVDLSPASWMAVAWYPIYHIPMGRTVKDLSTCFLTYHTLSSSFHDMDLEDGIGINRKQKTEGGYISLPSFGLATYKMQGSVWMSGGSDQDMLVSLLRAADSWLKQLRVQHHDFNHFTGT